MSNNLQIITTVSALIGACSWLPIIFHKLKRPRLYGKLIQQLDFFNNDVNGYKYGENFKFQGHQFLIKLRLIVVNGNFNIKDISTKVKYKNEKKEVDCKVFFINDTALKVGNIHKVLSLKYDDTLLSIGHLQEDKAYQTYLSFYSNKITEDEIEHITIKLTNFKGKKISCKLNCINTNDLINFEEDIWDRSIL